MLIVPSPNVPSFIYLTNKSFLYKISIGNINTNRGWKINSMIASFLFLPKYFFSYLVYSPLTVEALRTLGVTGSIKGDTFTKPILIALAINVIRVVNDSAIIEARSKPDNINDKSKLNPGPTNDLAKNKGILSNLFGCAQIVNLALPKAIICFSSGFEAMQDSRSSEKWFFFNTFITLVLCPIGWVHDVTSKVKYCDEFTKVKEELKHHFHHKNKLFLISCVGVLLINLVYSPAIIEEVAKFLGNFINILYGLINNIPVEKQEGVISQDDIHWVFLPPLYIIIALVTMAELLENMNIAENFIDYTKLLFEKSLYILVIFTNLLHKLIIDIIVVDLIFCPLKMLCIQEHTIKNCATELLEDISIFCKLIFCGLNIVLEVIAPIVSGPTMTKIILPLHFTTHHMVQILLSEDNSIREAGEWIENSPLNFLIIFVFMDSTCKVDKDIYLYKLNTDRSAIIKCLNPSIQKHLKAIMKYFGFSTLNNSLKDACLDDVDINDIKGAMLNNDEIDPDAVDLEAKDKEGDIYLSSPNDGVGSPMGTKASLPEINLSNILEKPKKNIPHTVNLKNNDTNGIKENLLEVDLIEKSQNNQMDQINEEESKRKLGFIEIEEEWEEEVPSEQLDETNLQVGIHGELYNQIAENTP